MLHDLFRLGIVNLREIGGEYCAPRQQPLFRIKRRIFEHTPGEEIRRAFAHAGSAEIERRNSQQVGDKHVVDPVLKFLDPEEIVLEIVHGRHMRYASRRTRHGHRHPAAEESAHLGRLGLHFKRFQIMGHGNEVHIGRQLICRVSPISVGERAELAGADKRFQLGLDFFKRRLLGLCVERRDHINIIERVQMVEPENMGVDELGSFNDVPDDTAVVRYLYFKSIIHAH